MCTIHWLHKWNKQCSSRECKRFRCCDAVMLMYNLSEYSNDHTKTSGSLWQYYGDDPSDIITNSESLKFKIKITGGILK